MRLTLLVTALLLSFTARALEVKAPDGWTEAKRDKDYVVFFQDDDKLQARNILAYTELDATPEAAFNAVTDYANAAKFVPYVKESRIFKKNSPTDLIVYQVLAPPMTQERDFFLHVKLTRGSKASGGLFRCEWSAEPDTEPEHPGIIRMRLNQGFWTFEPLDGGKRTRVSYSVMTNPGGGVPKWQSDQPSIDAVPNVFKGLRERLKGPAKAASASH